MCLRVCVSANPPCLFRSVFACLLYLSLGGSLQVPEHPLKTSKESPEKCDNQRLQVDKRSWGVLGPRRQHSSGIRLALISAWSASWSLKYDAGIHSASSAGYPCHRTRNSLCRRLVLDVHRQRRIFSTSKYCGRSGSSSSTSPGTDCNVLGLHCLSSDTWNTGWMRHVSGSLRRYA